MSFSVYRKIANFILLLMTSNLSAQVTYYDAAEFQLLGKATAATTERYVRLPDSGTYFSFTVVATKSELIGYGSAFPKQFDSSCSKMGTLVNFHMDHMTDVAVKGLDL